MAYIYCQVKHLNDKQSYLLRYRIENSTICYQFQNGSYIYLHIQVLLTACVGVSKLFTNNSGISRSPTIITDCVPSIVNADLDSAFILVRATLEPDIAISTWSLRNIMFFFQYTRMKLCYKRLKHCLAMSYLQFDEMRMQLIAHTTILPSY